MIHFPSVVCTCSPNTPGAYDLEPTGTGKGMTANDPVRHTYLPVRLSRWPRRWVKTSVPTYVLLLAKAPIP